MTRSYLNYTGNGKKDNSLGQCQQQPKMEHIPWLYPIIPAESSRRPMLASHLPLAWAGVCPWVVVGYQSVAVGYQSVAVGYRSGVGGVGVGCSSGSVWGWAWRW
jgi:hypothetical protein